MSEVLPVRRSARIKIKEKSEGKHYLGSKIWEAGSYGIKNVKKPDLNFPEIQDLTTKEITDIKEEDWNSKINIKICW